MCAASNTIAHLLWNNCGPNAGWRRTKRSHAVWEQDHRIRSAAIPLLFRVFVGLTISAVAIDTLHVVDLGVAAHVLGNMFLLVCFKRRGGSIESRVAALGDEIEAWHRARRQQSGLRGKLTLQRLKSESGFPKFKGKGASVRSLLPFALDLARREHLEDRIIGIATYLNEFYDIIHQQSLFLEQQAVDRLGFIVNIFCNLYTDLSRHYFDKDEKYFKATPKLHLFLHLAEDQVKSFQINPKQFWCYADEDLVGQLVEIASATHPSSLAELGLIKWLLLTLGPKE